MSLRQFRLIFVVALLAVATHLGWMLTNLGGDAVTRFVDDWAECAAALVAAGLCGYAAKHHHGQARRAWVLLAVATASWGCGEAVWSWLETVEHHLSPFPSLADAGYLGMVPFQILGVLFLAVGFRGASRVRILLDAFIIAGALFLISWLTVLRAVYTQGAGDTLSLVLSLAYPSADIVTLVIVLTVAAHARRLDTPFLYIAAGICALTLSDSTFAYITATTPYPTNPIDAGWVAGFILVGLGGLRSTMATVEPESEKPTTLRVLIPYVPLAVAAPLTVFELARGQHLDGLALGAIVTIVALVLFRQAFTVLEITVLTRKLETSLVAIQDREARLEYQAFHDNLTNLANRQLFQDRLDHALARAKRTQSALGLLFLDLDDFKTVNDTMGHAAGDLLIIAAAERLRGCVRPGDTVARLGGDEFAVLLEDVADRSDATKIAKRVLDAFEAPFNLHREVYVSISIGITVADDASVSVTDLLRDADTAMYAAKGAGKSRYAMFEENLRVGFADRLELRNRLARAIEDRELAVHFQPIYDLGSKRLVGAEALARWECDGQMIPPSEFIPLAEDTGLITALGRLILQKSCAEASSWASGGRRELSLSVNVSAHQLNHSGFVDDVKAILRETGLEPKRLVLEITENALMLDTALILDRLNSLAEVGVRLAIDDFGTGYSALHYLQRFPVSIVKIDRAFVDGLPSPTNRALVASIASLCQSLGMVSVAEGIETTKQFSELRKLDCKAGQGYLLSRPVRAEEMRLLVADANSREARVTRRTPATPAA